MKMKKLICVMALVCIGMLLVSCGSKRLDNPKAQFIRDFGLNIEKKDCVLEELFNNYEGVPYEGILSVFLVVFATMMYAMRKVKKDNPIDALKNENL